MSFGREKRFLLGLLAALAPLPLPFNDILDWGFLAAYLAAVAAFLWRVRAGRERWLAPWMMNLLGLAYIPFFVFDLLVLGGGRLVGPVVHLGLFTVVIKLFAVKRERDKWQVAVGIFFVFLAAMATSVHPSIVLYLTAFLILGLLLLSRFAFLHILASFGHKEDPSTAPPAAPLRGFLAVATVFTLVLAVPLFALLPRVRSPYIVGRGTGTGTTIEAAGFSDEVTLDSIGLIRESREVAFRIDYDAPEKIFARSGDLRFKAGTFDVYDGRAWERTPRSRELTNRHPERPFPLSPETATNHATIFLRPLGSRSLVLPSSAVSVKVPILNLHLGAGGALALPFRPVSAIDYRVGLIDRPVPLASPPADDSGSLDQGGVTPRIAALAARVMGQGSDALRAGRVERYLATGFEYTLDFVGRSEDDSLEDFLFRYKSGHCEYFASAMVLMLRSQGIPSRLVTGFLGAEYNPLEGLFVVRQRNAHAWVEAYLRDEGVWRTFDPTPPAGRPGEEGNAWLAFANQAWDYLQFRWDRYVLTYGFYDQMGFFVELRRLWHRLFPHHRGGGAASVEPAGRATPVTDDGLSAPPAHRFRPGEVVLLALLVALCLVLAVLLFRRYRQALPATESYRLLRLAFGRSGLALAASDPPLAFRARAVLFRPAAAEPAGRIVELYLRESFAGAELSEEERDELREALGEARRALRKGRNGRTAALASAQ